MHDHTRRGKDHQMTDYNITQSPQRTTIRISIKRIETALNPARGALRRPTDYTTTLELEGPLPIDITKPITITQEQTNE